MYPLSESDLHLVLLVERIHRSPCVMEALLDASKETDLRVIAEKTNFTIVSPPECRTES
jgi:hypothetical protein